MLERGKPETGQIVLRAYHEGGLVNIEISDDGAGIDAERVRDKALRMGLISRDQARAMTDQQVKQLIFSPGLSTAERVTDISGRGVGMDVVKTNIERIGGSVAIDSRVGQGTTLRVKIPLTLAIIPALIVVTRGERFAIPQVSLREIITFQEGAGRGVDAIGTARVYRLRGELLPLVDLREVLHLPALDESGPDIANIMVLQAVGQRFGLIVDRVRNTEEIVVKPLHKTLARLSVFSGATIMGDGRVALILDVVGLARIAGVVDLGQDTGGQTVIESDETEEVESNGFGDYLVCDVGHDRQVAVSLPEVTRLEEIPATAIQTSTGQPVVPYRNHIMPLLHLERTGDVAADAQGTVPVVVHAVGRRYVGLIVNRIVDIATADQEMDTSQRQSAIRGRTLIGGRVIDIVDIRELGSGVRNQLCLRAGSGGQAMTRVRQYSTFFVDRFHFGVQVDHVQEALLPMPTTRVPLTTDVVDGLINLRGQIVMAIDLRARLNMPRRVAGQPSVSLILRTANGLISLRVDHLGDVLDLDALSMETLDEEDRGDEMAGEDLAEIAVTAPLGDLARHRARSAARTRPRHYPARSIPVAGSRSGSAGQSGRVSAAGRGGGTRRADANSQRAAQER